MWAYLTASIVEPVAFVNKKSSGVSRVVVFTVLGVQGVYDRYNLMFAIQVGSWTRLVRRRKKGYLYDPSLPPSQCHSAEPEDVVEKLLEVTDTARSR